MPPSPPPAAEFDAYADGYDAGMGNPLKRLVGASPADFLRVKVRWLLTDLTRGRPLPNRPAVLDYGCGPGEFLAELSAAGFAGRLAGCDVSSKMLALARKRWTRPGLPDFFSPTPADLSARGGQFDVVVISAVLHHVPADEQPGVYRNLFRLTKPGGRVYVFEHNPFNPVTVWVVKNTPIDANAVLVTPAQVRAGLSAAGFSGCRTRYLMFLPPRLTPLHPVESLIRWLPLGGQFVVRADRAG